MRKGGLLVVNTIFLLTKLAQKEFSFTQYLDEFHRAHVLLTTSMSESMVTFIMYALCTYVTYVYRQSYSNPVIPRVYRKSMVYIGQWCHCTRSIWSGACNILLTVHTVSCSTCRQMLYTCTYMILCKQCGHRPMNNTT